MPSGGSEGILEKFDLAQPGWQRWLSKLASIEKELQLPVMLEPLPLWEPRTQNEKVEFWAFLEWGSGGKMGEFGCLLSFFLSSVFHCDGDSFYWFRDTLT